MPAFTPGTNVAQVVMQYLLDNEQCENVWWFFGVAAWDHATLETLAGIMRDWEVNHALPLRTTNCSLQRVIATDWSTLAGVQAQNATGLPLDGDQTDPLPNHCTAAIKLNTDQRGRSFRGRHYWIGLHEGYTLDNTLTTAFINAVVGVYNLIPAAVVAVNGAIHVVYSQFHLVGGVSTRRTAGVATEVTAYTINQFIDSQRRRLPGHNRHH